MSIQFGFCHTDRTDADERVLEALGHVTRRFAPAGNLLRVHRNVGMGLQRQGSHAREELESGPVLDPYGNMLSLDGRIDNHAELCQELELRDVADSTVVLAAFRRWGEECFSKMVGDWAVALWSGSDQALYLARDHAGARTLYFEVKESTVFWSTYLETCVASQSSVEIAPGYVARYLAGLSIQEYTPYVGIQVVRPAHYLRIAGGRVVESTHWSPIPRSSISYSTDQQYDEHFLSLFEQSIKRRMDARVPIVAELSGGMDSSSIVCMSDRIAAHDGLPDLDTISYYDDSESSWDEKPYFMAVEAQRKKTGIHLDTASFSRSLEPLPQAYTLPGSDRSTFEMEHILQNALRSGGYRIILSGIGGDELLGGVPSGSPELADLMMRGRLSALATQSVAWSLPTRQPVFKTLREAATFVWTAYHQGVDWKQVPPWLSTSLRNSMERSDCDRSEPREWTRVLPSALMNGKTWWHILETLPHLAPRMLDRYEFRYPYLDRDLAEFLHRLPHEQLVQPGRRRFLMRRALRGIVPEQVLERRRKGYLIRKPLMALQRNEAQIRHLLQNSIVCQMFDLHMDQLQSAFELLKAGDGLHWRPAFDRFILLELWLRAKEEPHASFSHVPDGNGGDLVCENPSSVPMEL